ncbi:CCR4-NOT transcription complex subunit 4-like [Asterias rubens]|uniref:CCR4-NOT transcription complex subunit 4-like n=1 Tax=Asterias rubens TaxID=7604 RepID=UPI0014557A93|nr:CCR4-NOT transcription complex subunit 4-like [Asterias rubens]
MKPESATNHMEHVTEPDDCPLCMEPLEIDDINFYPCTCGYQICRFCWHRIRTDENGLCPACRKAYPECPADFKPLTEEELQRIKNEKRQKDHQRKQKITDSRKHLASVRVVQKNLVFVVGLSQRLADTEVLKKSEYFGKFGKIVKVVINQNTSYAGSQGPSASAYVTYNKYEDALRAIQAVNNVHVDGRTLKASLGTTKYCSHFLKNSQCPKPDCMYLHELGDLAASFTKEDMQAGKHQEYEQKLAHDVLGGGNGTTPQPIHVTTTTAAAAAVPVVVQQPPPPQQSEPQPLLPQQPLAQPQQQQQQAKQKGSNSNNEHSSKKHSKNSSRKKPSTSPVSQSPPTNHTDPWPALAVPSSKSNELHTPPSEGSPPVALTNHMSDGLSESPPTSVANTKKKSSRYKTEGIPIPNSVQSPPTPVDQSPQPVQRSPFETTPEDPGVPSFFPSVNGFMSQSILPSLLPPVHPHLQGAVNGNGFPGGSTVPPLIPPHHGSTPSGDWSNGLIMNNDVMPVASHTDWQAAFGFTSSETAKDLLNEDDLGFDPWNESNKGLADLLEKELQLGIAMTTDRSKPTQPPPGFTSPANHSLGFESTGGSKMLNWLQMDRTTESRPQNSVSPPSFNNTNSRYNHSPAQHQLLLEDGRQPESLKNWQDGLRALLPNINISFGASDTPPILTQSATLTTQNNSDVWSDTSRQAWMVHDPAIISVNSHNSHAPGFTEKDGMTEEQPHWLKSLQTLTDGDTPTHPSANHLFPTNAYANRGPAWTTHPPPPGLRPPTQTPDTHTHTLTENHAV